MSSSCAARPVASPATARGAHHDEPETRAQTRELAKALRVRGLMNVQYAIKDNDIYVIEVNPRVSRSSALAQCVWLPVSVFSTTRTCSMFSAIARM